MSKYFIFLDEGDPGGKCILQNSLNTCTGYGICLYYNNNPIPLRNANATPDAHV